MEERSLPIGIENFEDLRQQGYYYVDKTGMIRELLHDHGEVNLFTRPRRFGKSLNMSMLRAFFEAGSDPALFEGLEISKETELCRTYQGRCPVLFFSLKDVWGLCYEEAMQRMQEVIRMEADRISDRLDPGRLDQTDRDTLAAMRRGQGERESCLRILTRILRKYYGRKVIVLIDEYDVPLQKAGENGYYPEMVSFLSHLFSIGLKTNEDLFFSVVTGCLRIVKESIFTGFNHARMYTITDAACDEWFGFTDDEVRKMLHDYDLDPYYETTREWYDGYRIGNREVYNPRDVTNWCSQLRSGSGTSPRNYWANSSANAEVKHLIDRLGDGLTKLTVEKLIAGETIEKRINQELTYDVLYDSMENIWGLLFMTGYLTLCEEMGDGVFQLRIPNLEVRSLFTDLILARFRTEVRRDGASLDAFCDALERGDAARVEELFAAYLKKTVSIRDNAVRKSLKENFYHGILLGLLSYRGDWDVSSNRESGDGYGDIFVECEEKAIGIVIEVEYAEGGRLDAACRRALEQISRTRYTERLVEDEMTTLLKYGIACCRNRCRAAMERETGPFADV